MASRSERARELHEQGMPCAEISKQLGITRQAVSYAIKYVSQSRNNIHKATIQKIRYPNLAQWLLDNNVSIAGLARLANVSHLYSSLCGETEPKKSTIDAILSITGMTYEECFYEST